MLLQFSVENFRSFKDRTTFSMLVAEGSTPPANAYVEVGGYKVLRAAAIYGANAAGKSNLIKAMSSAAQLVLTGTSSDLRIGVVPFRLDAALAKAPSTFEFQFLVEGTHYAYGFRVDTQTVREEWLSQTRPGGDEAMLFERHFDEATPDDARIELGSMFTGENKQFVGFVAKSTRRNQLFVTEAGEKNVKELAPVRSWFRDQLWTVGAGGEMKGLSRQLWRDADFRDSMGALLGRAGTGIAAIRAELVEAEFAMGELNESLRASMTAVVRSGRTARVDDFEVIEHDGKLQGLRIVTTHVDATGAPVEFREKDESDGTRRLMHLLPVVVPKGDRTFVFDEIDRSLHTLLTRQLLVDFLATDGAAPRQLIFTTHDTNLLSSDLLPPEAIWFAEKDAGGATHLYSLLEFEPTQLEHLRDSLEKGYLAGRFGAIPFFGSADRLKWPAAKKGE